MPGILNAIILLVRHIEEDEAKKLEIKYSKKNLLF